MSRGILKQAEQWPFRCAAGGMPCDPATEDCGTAPPAGAPGGPKAPPPAQIHVPKPGGGGGGGGGSPAPTSPSNAGSPASPSGTPSAAGGHASGGPPSQSLTEALTRAGIDPQLHPLISGFSAVEGNNPSGAPTLGFTDSQAGSSLDEHAQALAKQLKDRQSVAGPFPAGASPSDQAGWMATVVGQQGVGSDWQGNAQPARSDYINRVVTNMPSQRT